MAGNFSLIAQALTAQEGQRFETGQPRQAGARTPATKGTTRGSLGSLGARGLQTRNVDAGDNKEREKILGLLTGGPVPVRFTSRRIRAMQSAKLGRVQ